MKLGYPGSLHNHTEYSNLRLRDSINKIDELINYAIELGHEVIAITEHDTVANAIKVEKYYNKIKEKNPNFKVILGNEIYLVRDGLDAENYVRGEDRFWHFILLAKDAIGHQQIREISTRAHLRSFMQGKMRRVPTYYNDLIEIIGKNPGHVIGSTACLGGFLPSKILQWAEAPTLEFYNKIINWCRQMQKIFGEGDFYLEMQPSSNKEQVLVNRELLKISNSLNIPYIITTDSHYCKKEDAPIHSAFLKSQEGEREVASFYATTYLMGTEEIEDYMTKYSLFDDEILQKAYQSIIEIKNKCEDYSLIRSLKIPSLKWRIPQKLFTERYNFYFKKMPYLKTFKESDFNGDNLLVDLIIEKIESDPRLQKDEIYTELNDNLKITWISSQVNKTHWSAYFLNLQNIIDVCWGAGSLVGPGRGSGVGFLLLYILDIIQINPMWEQTKTYSWRFLNPDRVSVLD